LREVEREMKAANKQQITQYNHAMSIAWHTAYLHRVEKMPQLKSLLIDGKKSKKQQPTWEQQQAAMLAWASRTNKE
jgi:hypothetical protein